jgi:hypothetical protein
MQLLSTFNRFASGVTAVVILKSRCAAVTKTTIKPPPETRNGLKFPSGLEASEELLEN